jgi:hypothetical protein
LSIFGRACHALEVVQVADGLKVSTANKKIDFAPILLLYVLYGFVDLVQFAMAAAFDSNL